jgi:hypothetical protein
MLPGCYGCPLVYSSARRACRCHLSDTCCNHPVEDRYSDKLVYYARGAAIIERDDLRYNELFSSIATNVRCQITGMVGVDVR